MQFLGKSYVGTPPGELAPPPRGNPGSATVYLYFHLIKEVTNYLENNIICVRIGTITLEISLGCQFSLRQQNHLLPNLGPVVFTFIQFSVKLATYYVGAPTSDKSFHC